MTDRRKGLIVVLDDDADGELVESVLENIKGVRTVEPTPEDIDANDLVDAYYSMSCDLSEIHGIIERNSGPVDYRVELISDVLTQYDRCRAPSGLERIEAAVNARVQAMIAAASAVAPPTRPTEPYVAGLDPGSAKPRLTPLDTVSKVVSHTRRLTGGAGPQEERAMTTTTTTTTTPVDPATKLEAALAGLAASEEVLVSSSDGVEAYLSDYGDKVRVWLRYPEGSSVEDASVPSDREIEEAIEARLGSPVEVGAWDGGCDPGPAGEPYAMARVAWLAPALTAELQRLTAHWGPTACVVASHVEDRLITATDGQGGLDLVDPRGALAALKRASVEEAETDDEGEGGLWEILWPHSEQGREE